MNDLSACAGPPPESSSWLQVPGYGKTTFVADACRRSGTKVAWFGLDFDDQDPEIFLEGGYQAIKSALPDFSSSAMDMVRHLSGESIPGALQAVLSLLEDLEEQLDGPLSLVIDDFHLVESPAINRLVSRLVKYTPSALRLILISRTMPSLELAHLRAKGELELWGERELQLADCFYTNYRDT
ncbi:MAG: hypothetical protein HY692_01155, partial [Cyanobacteria bacterium NC_groundwater_1444_Ag_S-0.65um_54_12]|nr:hypothetical protein [Cyanobacteria bacterium NC_groundwater_1444_Ag_S-0.65um_54_12]